MRAAFAALAAILLMGGGFFYGSLQREEREQRRQRRAAAAARAEAGPSAVFEPSNLAIVEEEERSQAPPPRLFSVDDLAKVNDDCVESDVKREHTHIHQTIGFISPCNRPKLPTRKIQTGTRCCSGRCTHDKRPALDAITDPVSTLRFISCH